MTQEQYHKVIAINDRIKDLERVKKEIDPSNEHRLTYSYKCINGKYDLCSELDMRLIGDLLDKHDIMIREEINKEIDTLQKEIEQI